LEAPKQNQFKVKTAAKGIDHTVPGSLQSAQLGSSRPAKASLALFYLKYRDTEQKFGTGAYLKGVELLNYTEPVNFILEQY